MSSRSSNDPLAPASPPRRRPSQHHEEQEMSFSDMGSFSDFFEHLDDDVLSTFASNTVTLLGQPQVVNGHRSSISSVEPAFVPSSSEGTEVVNRNEDANTSSNPDATRTNNSLLMIPNKNDVLLGRGGKNNQHSGNEQLRHMAREMSHAYAAAPKRNKPAIAWLLVTKLRSLNPPGRFLKQENGRDWVEVDDDVAREKASQCLRDIVAALTKKSTKVAVPPSTASFLLNTGKSCDLSNDTNTNYMTNSMLPVVSSMSTQSLSHAKLNLQQTQPSQLHSRAAQAGLAMLQNGMGSKTANSGRSSLANLRLQNNVSQASLTGSAMNLHSIEEDVGSHHGNSSMGNLNASFTTNSAMQISSQDLLRLQQTTTNTNAAVMQSLMERKRRFASASAPSLGDSSMLFSKRYRGMVSAEEGGEFSSSNMRNATFTTQPMDNPLEPIQLEELQQKYGSLARQLEPRAASMMNLGGGARSSSMMNLVGTKSNTGGSNIMLQLQQLQRQSKGNATWNSSGSRGNATWSSTSESAPSARNMFLQQSWRSSSNTAHSSTGLWGQGQPSSSNANAFASIIGSATAAQSSAAMRSVMHRPEQQQPPPIVHATPSDSNSNMTFFTGMGSVTGEDDEAALQRWIDRMAEEDLG